MNRQTLSNICDQIYRRYPEVAGKSPKVQNRPGDQVLLVFSGSVNTADGHRMPRTVRVVAGLDGKIIKVSTSK